MRLWVRAELSPAVGMGHVMRCVALAEVAASAGHEVTFVLDDAELGASVLAPRGLASVPAAPGWARVVAAADAVVLDGYSLPPEAAGECRARGAVVVVCDDGGAGDLDADVVVNPSPPPRHRYTVPDGAALLLGPAYALVRAEFRRVRGDGARSTSRTLVISLGGSDPGSHTAAVAAGAVAAAAFDRVVVVRGPLAARDRLPAGVEVVVAPPDLAGLFASAAAAIAAAGTTTWELLCVGVPTGLVVVADNQRPVADVAVSAGAALLVDDPEAAARRLADGATSAALAAAGRALVDGRGAERVLDAVLSRAARR